LKGRYHGMQLRFKLAAIASSLALTGGLGVAFAGSAAATNEIKMCSFDQRTIVCSTATERSNAPVEIGGYPGGGAPWDAPTSGKHQISYWDSHPTLCMELDASRHDTVFLESCKGKAAEEWTAVKTHVTIGSKKLTAYYYKNGYKSSLCLSPPAGSGDVIGAKCNFGSGGVKQRWFFQP
jgi:hypothetical protein